MDSVHTGSKLYNTLSSVTKIMNIVGMVILVAMMLLTVSDVFLRYFFNSPIIGGTEVTEYMMVCLVLGVPWCTLTAKTVKMELIVERLPQRVQSFFDSFTDMIGLFAMSCLSWQLFKEMINAHSIDYSSPVLKIQSYPFFGVLAFAIAMMCIALVANIAKNMVKGVKG